MKVFLKVPSLSLSLFFHLSFLLGYIKLKTQKANLKLLFFISLKTGNSKGVCLS